jgi:hypothetical protein
MMIRVSANAGLRVNCQAVLGTHGLCVYSERNSSAFELTWMIDVVIFTEL